LGQDGAGAKRRLRAMMAARCSRVSAGDAAAAGAALAAAALEEPRIRRARRMALYAARVDEVPTRALFEALGSLSIARFLPRIEAGEIAWCRAEDWNELRSGRFGIPEPAAGPSELLTPSDVVLVPGLAFDRGGWRLGRGGGHYDRAFPPGSESPWLVGVGYSFQWIAEVPHDSRDRRVDAIVTENGWAWRAWGPE
jgi:5-formyltetrahydrofolate cyclo-ligase